MSLLFSSHHHPSLLFDNSSTTTATTSAIRHFAAISPSFSLRTRRIKSTSIRFSSNKPPPNSGWNPVDQTVNDDEESDGTQPPKVTDEWGEKSEREIEPLTRLSTSDPPIDEDEWGPGAPEKSNQFSVCGNGNGSPAVESTGIEDDSKIEELKRCLVDSVYGTGLGFRASPEERAEVMELVTQLEADNPTPAPTDAVDLLDGNWILLYTAFSELLPLLAVGTTPLLKVDKICQEIFTSSLTIDNSITFSTPFATFTSTASANFEVRSPSRIQVQFKEGSFQPPKIKSNVSLHRMWIFLAKISVCHLSSSLSILCKGLWRI